MNSLPVVGVFSVNFDVGNIASRWPEYLDYVFPTRTPIDANPVFNSTPRWTAVQQPESTLVPKFATLDPSLPARILGELQTLLADPGAFAIVGNPLWQSVIPDPLATRLDHLPNEISMAGHGFSGNPVTTDVRATVSSVAVVAVRGIVAKYNLVLDSVSFGPSTQPNSWWNDWSMKCGEDVVVVGQDHSFESLKEMQGLQTGLMLGSSSTQEGLPAVLVQLGRRMLLANIRFAVLFSSVAFRLAEIEQGNVLLVSPAYWLSSDPPADPGMQSVEAKPLAALLTAMILAGLKPPLINPVPRDLGNLGLDRLSGTARGSPEAEVSTPSSGVCREQVLSLSYMATGVSPAARVLRRTRVLQHQPGSTPQPLISSPHLPTSRRDCPALGSLPNPPGLPEPRHSLVLHEHVAYEGCLEAWRGTLNERTRVLAKLFLHEHVESAHREASAYERLLSVPHVEGVIVPRYWGTYTFRGEFYVTVLEDTGPKLKSFRDCNPRQRETILNYARGLHEFGLGFPANVSHFTCSAEGKLRIVDFGDSFEHRCDPESCEELKRLSRLLNEVVPRRR